MNFFNDKLFCIVGFDHSKSLIHEHCKSLLVNLAVILVLEGDYSRIAHALMKFQYFSYCAADKRYSAGSNIPRDSTVLSLPEKEAPNERYFEISIADKPSLKTY
jgi:hypothetical protein